MTMSSRHFTQADQVWFASVSGDRNPLHMDAGFAGRRFPGEQVVHGMHALLWALDQHFRTMPGAFIGVKASFIKPILLNETVMIDRQGSNLQLTVQGELVAVAQLQSHLSPAAAPVDGPPRSLEAPPTDRSLEYLEALQGRLIAPVAASELVPAFPALATAAGAKALTDMALASNLVGMECPGLYSILSEVEFVPASAGAPGLGYRVTRSDARFSRVAMQVTGAALHGQVSAFAGRDEQVGSDEVDFAGLFASNAFAGQSPLIIGATSGLGAVTARLIAAGGGQPVLGYRSRAAADALLAQAPDLKSACLIAFDVQSPDEGLEALRRMGWSGDQAYYFASPRIFRRRLESYQAGDLDDFIAVFVTGFYKTVRGLLVQRKGATLTVFYPSSTALDEGTPDLFEYRIAKAAGEQLCDRLMQRYANLTIVTARLPRIETRQTRTFTKVKAAAPAEVMAPLIHQVQDRGVMS